ncbi:MAG TPA: phosphate starvation-inducible protein PhoH [Desulfobulbaceae bacterium]|nr:MAG: phosphate starvation-inducible protein PhoH [Deltaproteobacteria bacterium RIFOXYD12_FULL_53_23]HCC54737.1 phosphate starvation-inducible protein PhoH [Desulfobulbaceae bacterium]
MKKYFVLDTNVLLHNADSITSFADNTVVLPISVIEELDKFKSHNDELGRNARHVIRQLDDLRQKGKLGEGVPMNGGGALMIYMEKDRCLDPGLDMQLPDNRILAVAFTLFKQGEKVIFVSKDINARLKADALGLEVMDFEKQKVNIDELYQGQREMLVPGSVINEYYQNKQLPTEGLNLMPNEFVLLRDEADEKHTALTRAQGSEMLGPLRDEYETVWNIRSRSKEQRIAFELLMDPAIQLVTLVGQAGTGKTLLALAAALECVISLKRYDRILVSRPIIPMGKDLGYMPGDKDEKLAHWMQPIFDNLTYLMADGPRRKEHETDQSAKQKVDKLLLAHVVELEALTYIRGRSIPKQFVIVDEAQNLTPHEVKTIISRAGEGTKMVLTGDPDQIDNPYLDSSSNGLTYAVERLKEQKIHGHITLRKSERSELAAVAADFL